MAVARRAVGAAPVAIGLGATHRPLPADAHGRIRGRADAAIVVTTGSCDHGRHDWRWRLMGPQPRVNLAIAIAVVIALACTGVGCET
jgi:hypothetical protein